MFTAIEDLNFVTEPEIRRFCGPLFFARSLESAVGNVTANGTYGLVDTGEKKLLVTCHHVWGEFQRAQLEYPELKIGLCLDQENPVVFKPSHPIDQDEKLDIATFDMHLLLPACRGRKFYPLYQNPAPRVKKKDLLAFVGYPGRFRETSDEGIEFGRVTYGVFVSDVSGYCVVADMSKVEEQFNKQPPQIAQSNPHGGISGSPCFLVKPNRPAQLVGFAHSHSTVLKILRFTSARCLNSDGTINRQAN